MTAKVSTRKYEAAHGHKPRGTGNWGFEKTGNKTAAECRFDTALHTSGGHDTLMNRYDRCASCGATRTWVNGTYTAARATLPAGSYTVCS